MTYNEQPYVALVCRLMVSALVIHVITWIVTHLPTQKGWKVEWPVWLTHCGHLTHEVVACQP